MFDELPEGQTNFDPIAELTARFNQVFTNVPLSERPMPIYVDEKHYAMSWYVVKLEVDNGTEVGQRALESLSKLRII